MGRLQKHYGEAQSNMLPSDLAVAPLRNKELSALIARLKQAEAALTTARNSALDEAIQACQKQALAFLDRSYAGPNPMNSFSERFACGECVNAIHALKDHQ